MLYQLILSSGVLGVLSRGLRVLIALNGCEHLPLGSPSPMARAHVSSGLYFPFFPQLVGRHVQLFLGVSVS